VTRLQRAYRAIRPPLYPGMKLTWKRFMNYQISRWEKTRLHTKLRAFPLVLTVEATNVCNLHCPYCFTGAGEVGRERSMMSVEFFRRLVDEAGDYALIVDFYNWGEPLLNKKIYDMIKIANDRGLATVVSTNFSFPFDEARAEALVVSGLSALGASIDGASQETLEKYRVGGNFERIMANFKLVVDAKRKLNSKTPVVTWAFHVFDHNTHEVEQARAVAQGLGVNFTATKGWVEGEDWDAGEYDFPSWTEPTAQPCKFLWNYAVVNNDEGIAPCAATFYKEDDFGTMEGSSFREVWNNELFQQSRELFRSRENASEEAKQSICYECPYTLVWDDFKMHRAKGLPTSSFRARYNTNDWFNYFFQKGPGVKPEPIGEVIDLQPVSAPRES
jgi:MoaA/NifB/PqqE/SkfB family radical SAM enzyme